MTNKNENKGKIERFTNFGGWEALLKNAPDSYKEMFEFEKEYLQRVVRPGSRVLDIGCGDGRSLSYLIGHGRKLYGFDNDREAVTAADKRFQNLNCLLRPDIRVAGDFTDKLDVSNYNYVLCMNLLGNMGKRKDGLIAGMKKLSSLRDGEVIVNVFNEDAFEERMNFYINFGAPISKVDGTTVYFDYNGGEHPSEQFSKDELTEMFTEHDLEPIEIIKEGIGYFGRFKKKKEELKGGNE